MELQCQSAINGSSWIGRTGGSCDAALRSAAENWKLLFQIDSDEDLGFSWGGDYGLTYFWVEEEAARRSNFSNVWLVLQCT